jgi:hypothetical protein
MCALVVTHTRRNAMNTKFMLARAKTHLSIASGYINLSTICSELHLKALSGTIQSEDQWAHNTGPLQQQYCPSSKDGSMVLTARQGSPLPGEGRDIVIAAVKVNDDGTYYAGTLVGGNHDYGMTELVRALRKAMESVDQIGLWTTACGPVID